MKTFKTALVTALAAGGLALLAAQPALADRPTARSLFDVQTIRVDGPICPARVSQALRDEGFLVTSGPADAVLVLDVATNGHLINQESMEKGVYSAHLVGANGRTLFSTGGSQESLNLGYLCEDIGEDIADDLKNAIG